MLKKFLKDRLNVLKSELSTLKSQKMDKVNREDSITEYRYRISEVQDLLDRANKKNQPEVILCSAIWYKDVERPVHRPINTPKGVVLCGYRHGHIIGQVVSLTGEPHHKLGEFVQGFLTNKNRFLNRKEALQLFKKNGNTPEFGDELYSEDLY